MRLTKESDVTQNTQRGKPMFNLRIFHSDAAAFMCPLPEERFMREQRHFGPQAAKGSILKDCRKC